MKAPSSGIVFGLALTLLGPSAALGQVASPSADPSIEPTAAATARPGELPASGPVADPAELRAALRSVDEVFTTEMGGKGRRAIVAAVTAALDTDYPAELVPDEKRNGLIERAAQYCTGYPGKCAQVGREMYSAYLRTGHEEFFDAAELIWASVPLGKENRTKIIGSWRRQFADFATEPPVADTASVEPDPSGE